MENSGCYAGVKIHRHTQDIKLCFGLQCLQQCLKEKYTGINNGILFKCWDCGFVLVFTLYRYRCFWVPYSKLGVTYTRGREGPGRLAPARRCVAASAASLQPPVPARDLHPGPATGAEGRGGPAGGRGRLPSLRLPVSATLGPQARALARGGGRAQRRLKVFARGHSVPCPPRALAPGHFPGERCKAAT